MEMESIVAEVIKQIETMAKDKKSLIIAIDGRCASGKSTFARAMKSKIDCNVFSMDDFFLMPHMRTSKRMCEIGGNVDYERFYKEVILQLKQEKTFAYRPFSCKTGMLEKEIVVENKQINIIEGSYSHHPSLENNYDLKIFFTVDEETQIKRIINRNGTEWAKDFTQKWIPMEEEYFAHFKVKEKSNLVYEAG